jgi:ABC-type glycerol-3-phosphate transport system substrate-binding protein
VSKYLQEKFNVTVEFSKPDADAAAKLNVMISAGDLPDSIMMDRGVDNQKLAELGLLVDLEPLMAKNTALRDNMSAGTIEQLTVGGKLYAIPNWSRKATSGGNDVWMYNQRLFEAAGSPELKTFEDLYAYAAKIKNEVKQTKEGVSVYPVLFKNGGDGWEVVRAFHRSMGGVLSGWYTVINGEYKLALREDKFRAATMEANRWWREGLMSETQFTDTGDQILEKLVAGRAALLWYDHSQNEANKFRTILRETFPEDSYEVVTPYPFTHYKVLPTSYIYSDIQSTVGWNVTCITTSDKDPQRIYDLWSYLMTPEAAILQMYGPQGMNWDELNDQGRPILKKAESELSSDEINQLGAWFWMIPGQSDNVDKMKFAVNDMQPVETRTGLPASSPRC